MNDTKDLKNVRQDMKAKKIKVKDLAQLIGVTPNTLSSALNGNRVLGTSAKLLLLQYVYGAPLRRKAS